MQNKVILVTGASAGIGEATARRLAKAGHTVYGGARRMERLQALHSDGVRPVHLDVTDDASMQAVVAQIEREAGGIDVLINNAGYGSMGALEEVPVEEARKQFDVNLFGLARMMQLVLPGMRHRGAGRIINISSVGGRMSFPLGAWYHASKHAVEGMSDSVRMETRGFGIYVSVVQPGGTQSEWAQIANQRAREVSGAGAYRDLARATEQLVSQGSGMPADTIAQLIQRAVEDARPKARYAPQSVRASLFLRRWLSDSAYDRLILWMAQRTLRTAAS